MVVAVNTTLGNISLSGDAILYVHNASGPVTLTVEGNVALADNALFFVNGSDLDIDLSYNVEYSLLALGTSGFALENATVTSNGYAWGMLYEQSTNLTVVDSMFCYPVGWVVTDLLQNATEWIVASGYHSDVLLYDTDEVPSTARFTAVDTAGFNLWLNLRGGASSNLTLPGLDSWQNFTFPGHTATTEVAYHVALNTCYVQLFAVMPWQGSNLTLENSPNVAIALNLEGSVNLSDLRQGLNPHFDLTTGDESIHLRNTTVFTWNVYPFAGTVSVIDSQIGETQVYNAANGTLIQCNLTGDGGYYGNQGTGLLRIENSTFHAELVATAGVTQLTNDSFDPPAPIPVLAAGTSVIDAENVALGSETSYVVLSEGEILVLGTLSVTVTGASGPLANATVEGHTDDPSAYENGYAISNGSGVANLTALGELIFATGITPLDEVLEGWRGDLYGSSQIAGPSEPTAVTLEVSPLILSTEPANDSSNVSTALGAVVIQFAQPMLPFTTLAAVYSEPAEPFFPSWSDDNQTLSLAIASLPSNTAITIVVGDLAETQSAVVMHGVFLLHFQTGPPAASRIPTVVSELPADGSESVARNASVEVTFSVPMNQTSLVAAFSVVPTPAEANVRTTATTIVWQPIGVSSGPDGVEPLAAGQLYVVTINSSARSAAGVPLAYPVQFAFETVGAPPANGSPETSPSSASTSVEWALAGAAAVLGALALAGWLRRRPPAMVASPSAGAPIP